MSKELFFNMRAEEMATMYAEDFSKKKAIETGESLVEQIFENGEVEPIKVFSNIVRLKEIINAADKAFRERIEFISKDSFNGVEFTPVAPRESLNYEDDSVYFELKQKLKEREELLKVARKSSEIIFDNNGIDIPKVTSSFTKPSITIKF